ncbi:hypothetical protein Nepgr_013930 [Nepenthes gracilis]|uniref:DUF1421 domain-containing protein n=1 Tax=Nepenthes gracilis TaxID=150966 RepID=A0AAD3XPN2_NEPGR|nr:hypothetical protein Nepgr_013930 [Nepenthes gracilis]
MASGSTGRGSNSGSKGFDFASDDILCSYEDYGNQESANGNHSDSAIGTNSSKDFQKSRMSRSSVFPTSNIYSQPEDSFDQEVISTVERTMKKHSDNLMRFLEGISSRLSQLELYCYNIDKSIGEMRSDLIRDHGESELKLKSLDKHLQEVHRSVQILRDKQELAETQKELAKLQLAQKESSSAAGQSQHDERSASPVSDSKKNDESSDAHNQQLALALLHLVAPQPQPVPPSSQTAPHSVSQSTPYYFMSTPMPNPQTPMPNPQTQTQPPQGAYPSANLQYHGPQVAPQPPQVQGNQTPQAAPPFPQYQQQWPQQVSQPVPQPQQVPQPVQPPQQPSIQPQSQVRASSPALFPAYMTKHPAYSPQTQSLANSMPMQASFSGIPQPGVSRVEAIPHGYGGVGRAVQPQLHQHLKNPEDGYAAAGPHLQAPSGGAYMMYEGEGNRPPQQPHYLLGGYPPASVALQNPQRPGSAAGFMVQSQTAPQAARNHPYNELIDKLVSMGYRGDHVVSVIQRLEESGQPVDFNAVLDRLNGHSSGGSQRGW